MKGFVGEFNEPRLDVDLRDGLVDGLDDCLAVGDDLVIRCNNDNVCAGEARGDGRLNIKVIGHR